MTDDPYSLHAVADFSVVYRCTGQLPFQDFGDVENCSPQVMLIFLTSLLPLWEAGISGL